MRLSRVPTPPFAQITTREANSVSDGWFDAHHVSALGLDERSKMRNEVIVLLAHPKGGLTGQSRYLPPSVVLGDIYTYVMG